MKTLQKRVSLSLEGVVRSVTYLLAEVQVFDVLLFLRNDLPIIFTLRVKSVTPPAGYDYTFGV